MSCGCNNNKKLNLKDMKNMPVDDIVRLYRDGYSLEDMYGDLDSPSGDPPKNNIYKMSPDATIIYTEGYLNQDSQHMAVDVLVRNTDPYDLVLKFDIYSSDYSPRLLKTHIACIHPYSIPQNGDGCTKVRIGGNIPPDMGFSDPYIVKVYRCISSPNCAVPSCANFQGAYDDVCTGEVKIWTGTVPPITSFPPSGAIICGSTSTPVNMVVDCASCTPSWTCMKDQYNRNTGYKYDSCTQQTVYDIVMCPLPPLSQSIISITTDSISPFSKGQVVNFYGTLKYDSTIISGADVVLVIDVGGTEVLRQHITTTSTIPNWSWNWTVPDLIAGIDTSGMSISALVDTGTTQTYIGSSAVANYVIAGISCTSLGISASKTIANVGDKITITTFTRPLNTSFPVIINLDGARLGTCDTLALGSASPMQQENSTQVLQESWISILNPPTSVMAGQIINFQILYHLTGLDWWGEIVRFRICTGSVELGYATLTTILGNADGTISFNATIPVQTINPMPLAAQVSLNQSLNTCADPDIIAQTSALYIPVQPSMNVLSIVNPPDAVVAGKTIDIRLDYGFISPSSILARFRICDNQGNELGNNIVSTSDTGSGTVIVSIAIPSGATGSITIKGEVTTNSYSQTCGDIGTIAVSTSRTIPITTQGLNTISLIDLPAAVRAGEAVDFKVNYNFDIGIGESVRVRICSSGTEIGYHIETFWWGGNKTGVYTVNSMIPGNATGNVAIKAELTKVKEDATCGSQVFAMSTVANIPVTTTKKGECKIVWDTTGSSGGDHFIAAEVLGYQACSGILRINLIAPPDPCTYISLGISKPNPVVGDVIDLVASVQPSTSILDVKFKANDKAIGSTCKSLGGSCTTKWNTTGFTPGLYRLVALVEGQCASIPLEVTLSSTVTQCTSITTPTATPSTVTIGQPITLKATAQPTTATFTVSFKDQNNNVLGTANTVSGVAALQWNTTGKTVGTYQIEASVGIQCTSPATVAVTLNSACTSITVPIATPSTVTIGQLITLKATVQPTTSTYAVDFKDQNNNVIGSANTINGVATIQWSTTGKVAGTYQIKAYTETCTSPAAVAVTLNTAPQCTSITIPTATPTTVTIGGTVALTAIAQPQTSIFSVEFKDNNNVLGTVETVNGVATLQWNTTGKTAGTYNIKASTDSCTSPAAVAVTLNIPTTACTSITAPTATPSTVTVGEVVTLSATAQPTTATFTVDFKDQNNNVIGSANTSTGVASYVWDTKDKMAGTYQIKAHVGIQCSSPTAMGVTINSTTTACTSITSPLAMPTVVTVGKSLALRATVQPTTSIFTVDFKDQKNNIVCSANTISGVATCNWNTTGKTAGTYQIKAYTGTCISPTAVAITLNPSEVTCTSVTVPETSLTTATIGGIVTLTTTVQPSTIIFTVAFKDQNNNVLGTVDTVNGVATLQWNTTGKTAGTYNIKASTDSCTSPAAVAVTLNTPTTACTSITAPIATPSTVTVGEVVTLSATAQPTTATFTVNFKDQNNNVIGSANTSTGVASYVWDTSRISAGAYQIKANVGTQCVSTVPITVTVNQTTATCISVTTPLAMPTAIMVGELVALRATVQPTTSIFTVIFKDQNNNIIGSANTISGVAAYNWNTTGKSAGTYQIKAYAGTCISPTAVAVTLSAAPGAGGGIAMMVGLAGVAALGMMMIKPKPK